MPGIPAPSKRRRPGNERPDGGRLPNRTPPVPRRVPEDREPDSLRIPLIIDPRQDREAPLYAVAGFHASLASALNN